MYLEISARQTGKTERLIDFAISKARKGERVLISVIHLGLIKGVKDRIAEKTKNDDPIPYPGALRHFVHTSTLIDVVHKCIDIWRGYKKYDWFCFDEFDFNPFIRLEYIGKNSYFVTSPKFLRKVEDRKKTDVLYQLILKKKGKYHCYNHNDPDVLDYYLPVNERHGIWKIDKNGEPILIPEYNIKYVN